MRVAFALLAEAAMILPDSRFSILGGDIFAFTFPAFPVAAPMVVVVTKFEFMPEEVSHQQSYVVRVDAVGPLMADGQNSIIRSLEQTVQPQPRPEGFEDIAPAHGIIAPFPILVFPEPGRYEFVIQVNGEVQSRLPLHVLLQNTQQPELLPDADDVPPSQP